MPKIESEKIDCFHRPCSRPAPRGKVESVRTHSEVIEQFDSFSLLKLLFLVRNWHWVTKGFSSSNDTPKPRKTAKTAVFRHRWQAWKVVQSIAAVRQRPRTPRNWRCSFPFFEAFLWHFNKKQRAEVIFRLSRPVSCKNQENGSGRQWSLHAPLKRIAFVACRDSSGTLFSLWDTHTHTHTPPPPPPTPPAFTYGETTPLIFFTFAKNEPPQLDDGVDVGLKTIFTSTSTSFE